MKIYTRKFLAENSQKDGCNPANSSCSIVSWQYNSEDYLNITIVGQGQNVWVGFGFSSTAGMKNSDIFYSKGQPVSCVPLSSYVVL